MVCQYTGTCPWTRVEWVEGCGFTIGEHTYLLLHALTTDTELYLWPWRSLGSDQSGIGTVKDNAVPTPASWRLVKVVILTGDRYLSNLSFTI